MSSKKTKKGLGKSTTYINNVWFESVKIMNENNKSNITISNVNMKITFI